MKLIRFIFITIFCVLADLSPKLIDILLVKYKSVKFVAQYSEYLNYVPWPSFFFGFFFAFVVYLMRIENSSIQFTKEEVIACTLICPMIKVISIYVGPLLGIFVSKLGMDPSYMVSFLFIFFTAVVINDGLFLGIPGIFALLIAISGVGINFAMSVELIKIPYKYKFFNLAEYYYSYIGMITGALLIFFETEIIDRQEMSERFRLKRVARRNS